jgi:hypothetical protein
MSDLTPGWTPSAIVAEGKPISIGGLNPWQLEWHALAVPSITVSHPNRPNQRHTAHVYELRTTETSVVFAASELSVNVWGFYLPTWKAPSENAESTVIGVTTIDDEQIEPIEPTTHETPLLAPPTLLERIAGAVVLSVAIGITYALIMFALGGLSSGRFMRQYNSFYYLGLAIPPIVLASMVAGFVIGIGRSVLLLSHMWGTATKKNANITMIIWLTLFAVGVVGALCLRSLVER